MRTMHVFLRLFLAFLCLPEMLGCRHSGSNTGNQVSEVQDTGQKKSYKWKKLCVLDEPKGDIVNSWVSLVGERIFFIQHKGSYTPIECHKITTKVPNVPLPLGQREGLLSRVLRLTRNSYLLEYTPVLGHAPHVSVCVEIYSDREAVKSEYVATPNYWRAYAAYCVLPDGYVLMSGGWVPKANDVTSSCEMYIPMLHKWVNVAPMLAARQEHFLLRLANGKVAAVGGRGSSWTGDRPSPLVEEYDPARDCWRANMPASFLKGWDISEGGSCSRPTYLQDGSPVLAARKDGESLLIALNCDTGAWPISEPFRIIDQAKLATLQDGRIFIVGTQNLAMKFFLFKPPSARGEKGEIAQIDAPSNIEKPGYLDVDVTEYDHKILVAFRGLPPEGNGKRPVTIFEFSGE